MFSNAHSLLPTSGGFFFFCHNVLNYWLVVLGFNATLTAKVNHGGSNAYVFPGFLTSVLTQLFFQSHRLLFSHASAEVIGENTPERKVASTGDQPHNHQVMSPTVLN